MKTLYLYHQDLHRSSAELQRLIDEHRADVTKVLQELRNYDARVKQRKRYREYSANGRSYWYNNYQAVVIPDDMWPAFLLRWM